MSAENPRAVRQKADVSRLFAISRPGSPATEVGNPPEEGGPPFPAPAHLRVLENRRGEWRKLAMMVLPSAPSRSTA